MPEVLPNQPLRCLRSMSSAFYQHDGRIPAAPFKAWQGPEPTAHAVQAHVTCLCRYGLFFLLRDVGTLTDDFGGFVGKLAAAQSPAYQLKLVNANRLPEASTSPLIMAQEQ